MNKPTTIKETISELRNIKCKLQASEDVHADEVYLKRLTELVVLFREKKASEKMRSYIVEYYMNRIEKDQLLKHLEMYIKELKKEAYETGENVDEPTVSGICAEVKNVCGDVLKVLCKEAGVICKDVGKTVAEDTPNCANAIKYLKGTPKRAEKALKGKLRDWLLSDEDNKTQ